MLFMALCEPCFYFVFEGQALRFTSAAQAGMVAAILPVLVAVLAWFFLGDPTQRFGFDELVTAAREKYKNSLGEIEDVTETVEDYKGTTMTQIGRAHV